MSFRRCALAGATFSWSRLTRSPDPPKYSVRLVPNGVTTPLRNSSVSAEIQNPEHPICGQCAGTTRPVSFLYCTATHFESLPTTNKNPVTQRATGFHSSASRL